jgi:hypothetical protein
VRHFQTPGAGPHIVLVHLATALHLSTCKHVYETMSKLLTDSVVQTQNGGGREAALKGPEV